MHNLEHSLTQCPDHQIPAASTVTDEPLLHGATETRIAPELHMTSVQVCELASTPAMRENAQASVLAERNSAHCTMAEGELSKELGEEKADGDLIDWFSNLPPLIPPLSEPSATPISMSSPEWAEVPKFSPERAPVPKFSPERAPVSPSSPVFQFKWIVCYKRNKPILQATTFASFPSARLFRVPVGLGGAESAYVMTPLVSLLKWVLERTRLNP
ncbi:hypothetical protein Q8A67_003449 [Cirrhinus molitorella]|uniref:Uncharacterized protein n=1 Tax=Cirrhinus molitorella TaxID=172907 RepID=A0AA88QF79_9TELE|nr:hypothetical protein Q8A67_003449 [Cirrhinus molitorella]